MDTLSLDQLRRDARKLSKAFGRGEASAKALVAAMVGAQTPQTHSDFLHIIARQTGFASWPRLKAASETRGLDRAAKEARLRRALYLGQHANTAAVLEDEPTLATGVFELEVALYDVAAVRAALTRDPTLAAQDFHGRRPILHLAFSRHHQNPKASQDDMLAVAELLRANGADLNDGFPHEPGSEHMLSALYGAIGHGNNMVLGQWMLDHGADPNDGESLYHATELGHHEGLKMLLAAGADPKGTNALFRAMDFDDVEAVRALIAAGADVGDYNDAEVGGEAPWVVRALHQVARRQCSDEMAALVIAHLSRLDVTHEGALPYAYARVFGNEALAARLQAAGADTTMTEVEHLLASAVQGPVEKGALAGVALPKAYADIIRTIQHLPGVLPHVERLIAVGLDPDKPDDFGLTPLHIAGWEGLPEMLSLFHGAGGNIAHINGYGGTLLSTVLHGSENNPMAEGRDYLRCTQMVLGWGVALPKVYIETTGREDILACLQDWAERHPERLV